MSFLFGGEPVKYLFDKFCCIESEGIKYSITLIPMILLGVTLIIMAFYQLDAKKYKEITDELAKRE
jgi:Na+/melibiose symporter-like transporter